MFTVPSANNKNEMDISDIVNKAMTQNVYGATVHDDSPVLNFAPPFSGGDVNDSDDDKDSIDDFEFFDDNDIIPGLITKFA